MCGRGGEGREVVQNSDRESAKKSQKKTTDTLQHQNKDMDICPHQRDRNFSAMHK